MKLLTLRNGIGFTLILFVSLLLVFTSCEKGLISPDGQKKYSAPPDTTTPAENRMKATFKDIQDSVFTPSCALSGCHVTNFYKPYLSEGLAFNSIVDVDKPFTSEKYIRINDSQNSWLMKRITGEVTPLMPQGGNKILQPKLDSIKAWIDNGAKNN